MAPEPAKRTVRKGRNEPTDAVEIDFVILADFAQADRGKLHLIGGGWNVFRSAEYPAVMPFGLGIAFLIPWSLTNQRHSFTFDVRKSEGPQILGGGGDVEVGREPGIPTGMAQRVTIGLSGALNLPEAGTYEISVETGNVTKRITFEAIVPRQ